jgi:4-hydroxy-tetrahydrodipicolinate reductase
MNIALVGYGKMGHTIERIAIERGHKIVVTIDKENYNDFNSPEFDSAEMVIEFSNPESALKNYTLCFDHDKPVVSGTTGWLDELNNIISKVEQEQHAFLYASNFSVGVNILFWLNKQLATLMDKIAIYDASLTETHHVHKLDAPSGTAISLADDIVHKIRRIEKWQLTDDSNENILSIKSLRIGEVFGIHEVKYESPQDIIKISHEAKSRDGFALGAVIAAEFLLGKKGFFTMDDVLKF